MKKLILISLICLTSIGVNAQKFAYVDSDYILERMPEYGSAQDQLDKLSLNWQEEIEELYQHHPRKKRAERDGRIVATHRFKFGWIVVINGFYSSDNASVTYITQSKDRNH